MPLDQVKIESVSEKGKHLLCAFNSVTSKYKIICTQLQVHACHCHNLHVVLIGLYYIVTMLSSTFPYIYRYELKMASTDSVFVISLHSFSHVHLPMKTLRV